MNFVVTSNAGENVNTILTVIGTLQCTIDVRKDFDWFISHLTRVAPNRGAAYAVRSFFVVNHGQLPSHDHVLPVGHVQVVSSRWVPH